MDVNTYEKLVNSNKKNIVILSASWCGPCQALAKTVEKIKESAPEIGKNIHKVDVDEFPELADHLSVMSVPTVVYIGDGTTISKKGVQPESDLIKWFM
jgi:thioredoxin 1